MKCKILLVEDDINLGFLLQDYLEANEFDVKLCKDGSSGLNHFQEGDYDFCILDIMLPSLDGFSLAKAIKKIDPIVPILFLTAKNQHEDKVIGFNLGADDYLTKPFNEEELLCRIKAVLSRIKMNKLEDIVVFGNYRFDIKNQLLKHLSTEKRLTKKEAEVLKILLKHQNEIVDRALIMNKVWGKEDYFINRSLDVFISKLRKYLSLDNDIHIDAIPNVGLILKLN